LWEESKEVRLLFVTMLALKNRDGLVIATMSGLKRLANLKAEEVESSVAVLEAPDTKAELTQEFQGRRIERCEGGWRILNHEKYRDLVSGTKRRAYQASWQKGYRDRKKMAKQQGYKDGVEQVIDEGLNEMKESHKVQPDPMTDEQRAAVEEEVYQQYPREFVEPPEVASPPITQPIAPRYKLRDDVQ
jgi:hypothetical protein